MNDITFLYITYGNEKEAAQTAMFLLEERLVACANIFPVRGLFWWDGKVVDDTEYALIVKSRAERLDEVVEQIKRRHSYKVPGIIKVCAQADIGFFEWISKVVK